MCSSSLSSSDELCEWPSLNKAHLVPKKGTSHVPQTHNPLILSLQAGVSDMEDAADTQRMQVAMQESAAQRALDLVQTQQYLELEQHLRQRVDGKGWPRPCSIFQIPRDGHEFANRFFFSNTSQARFMLTSRTCLLLCYKQISALSS